MSNEQRGDAERLTEAADKVEVGGGPVAVSRPGHKPVVLVSAEEWQRLEELESAEATAWWRRDAAERASSGEEPEAGEEGPGLDEAEFRRRFAHLFHDAGAATGPTWQTGGRCSSFAAFRPDPDLAGVTPFFAPFSADAAWLADLIAAL